MSSPWSHIVFADLLNELEVHVEICAVDYLNKCNVPIY